MPNVLIMPTPLRHRPGKYREVLAEAGLTPFDPPGFHRTHPLRIEARILPEPAGAGVRVQEPSFALLNSSRNSSSSFGFTGLER